MEGALEAGGAVAAPPRRVSASSSPFWRMRPFIVDAKYKERAKAPALARR